MNDSHAIKSLAELRTVIPEPNPAVHRKIATALDDHSLGFIGESPLVFVSTVDNSFNVDVSPKGDHPGFVLAEGNSTLLIPERTGNRLAYGFQNILQNGGIGLIFVVPGVRETLRINGTATLTRDPAVLKQFAVDEKPALLCTRVEIKECFFHCGKAMIRSHVWDSNHWKSTVAKEAAVKQISASIGISESVFRKVAEDDYLQNL